MAMRNSSTDLKSVVRPWTAALLGLLLSGPAFSATLLESEDTLYNLNLLGFFHLDLSNRLGGDAEATSPPIESGFEEARLIGHFSSRLGTRVSAFMEVEATATDQDSTLKVERILAKYDIDNDSQFSVGRFHAPVGYWNQHYHHGRWLQTSKDRPLQTEFGGTFLPGHYWGAMYERSIRKGDRIVELDIGAGAGRDEDISLPELDLDGFAALKHGGVVHGAGPRLRSQWSLMAQVNVVPGNRLGTTFGGSVWVGDLEGDGHNIQERILTGHVNHVTDRSALLGEVAMVQHDHSGSRGSVESYAAYLEYSVKLWQQVRPYGRVDFSDINDDDEVFAGLNSRTRFSLGTRFDVTDNSALKFEIRRDRFRDGGQTSDSLQAQYAVIFW